MKANNSILLVEDDIPLATSISEYLINEGFSVEIESNGLHAIERILKLQPDLVILDIMLPGKDGVSICREVRPNFDGYILMFTAKEDEIDQIVGLEVGADDYLIKPIKPRLMLAKVNSFLRRKSLNSQNTEVDKEIVIGNLTVDLVARTVVYDDVPLSLTSAEFELLALLAKHAGNILSRDDIARNTTGNVYDGLERTIDNKISSLRKKLNDDAKEPNKIKTVRSKGYILVPSAFQGESEN
jgi:DNA-binding response OmpR family regulator